MVMLGHQKHANRRVLPPCYDTGHRKHVNELVRAITGHCWYMPHVQRSVTHQHMVVLGHGWHVNRGAHTTT